VPGLEQYLSNPMRLRSGIPPDAWPLPDEHHLSWWRQIAAMPGAAIEYLGERLPQIRMTIREGASGTDAYAAAVLRGEPWDTQLGSEPYENPSAIRLHVHAHFAGSLPVLETPNRADFVHLYRALGSRCEPVDVPDGVHALFVSGIPNPARMRQLREEWGDQAGWEGEMKRLLAADRSWFYDRVIIMQHGGYGGLPAERVSAGMSEQAWVERSGVLRLEHECAHYATSRMLGSFRMNIHDELLADFMGFTKSLGGFSADLFLAAMGIEGDDIPVGARFRHYTAGLSEDEIREVFDLAVRAAASLETLAAGLPDDVCRASLLLALGEVSVPAMARSESGLHGLLRRIDQ
jgi:hypothetical protein